MIEKSIWSEEVKNNYKALEKDIHTDVLIIGGGLTGISIAYHLKDSDLSVCVVEKNNIGSGVTKKTTGKITYLQDLIYSKLEEKYNQDVSKLYYESQIDAITLLKEIINSNNIQCDLTKQKSYLFSYDKNGAKKIKKEKDLLTSFGAKVKDVKKLPIDIYNKYGISVENTYYFHPIKYLNNLAKICSNAGVSIYENTNINKFVSNDDEYICFTEKNKIFAKKIIFACHYPFFLFPFFMPIKGYLERSYVSSGNTKLNKNVSGINENGSTSFRYYQKNNDETFFILLKNPHNLRTNYNVLENIKELKNENKKLEIKPSYIWSNEDIITNDYLPYIGKLKENMYISTGYNTWGMTNATIAGKIISDLILEKENKYISLFNPKRSNLNIENILSNLYSSIKPFIENKINKNKSYYKTNVIFTKKNGKSIGIYIDEFNNKHIVYNKCPHMKCSLIFNELEKTWDCPCHSSRFDIDGFCIKGPSNYNISYKEKEKF